MVSGTVSGCVREEWEEAEEEKGEGEDRAGER